MSDYRPNRLRQPGGTLKRCTPSDPTLPTSACDCYICNNTGKPAFILVNFAGFYQDMGNVSCGLLNNNPETNEAFGTPLGGWQANYAGSANSDPFDAEGTGYWCSYVCDPIGPGGGTNCLVFTGFTLHGWKCEVSFGWSSTAGVFVTVILGADQDAPGEIEEMYYWELTGLEQYLVGGAGIGDIVCWGDRFTANSLAWLIDQSNRAANGGLGIDESWHWLREFSVDTSDGKCYICYGGAEQHGVLTGNTSQPDAVVTLFFDPHATKTAPPCCCGDKKPPRPCFYVCFTHANIGTGSGSGSGSGSGTGTGTGCGTGSGSCQPHDGVSFYLCYNSDTHAYEGKGSPPGSTTELDASLTEKDGAWSIRYGCGGLNASADLTVTATSPFAASADAQPNGGCGDGCVNIRVSRVPMLCPATNCPPPPTCGCPDDVPDEVKVTLPGLANANLNDTECPCSRCGAFGGEYVLSYSGPQAVGLFSFESSWSAWIPGHCGYPDDQPLAGWAVGLPCKYYTVNFGLGDPCVDCLPSQPHDVPGGQVFDCAFGVLNPSTEPTDALLVYYRGCSGAALALYQFAPNCAGGTGHWSGTQLWLASMPEIGLGDAPPLDPTKPCCPQCGATLEFYGQDTSLITLGIAGVDGTLGSVWCDGRGTTASVEPVC